MRTVKVLAPFDGISCGMVALKRAGFEVERYVAYEIDEKAVAISRKNYPEIEQRGDVFEADFTQFKGFDILMGGSPCTYWSIGRMNTGNEETADRETTSEGAGYELFKQYVRAKEESRCRWFLYENNKSISQDIKDEISKALGVQPIVINSNLVSAQDRQRCYWTNIPVHGIPEDRGILLKDIAKQEREWFPLLPWCFKHWGKERKVDTLRTLNSRKSFTLTTNRSHSRNYYLSDDRMMMTKLTADEAELLQTLPAGYTKDCGVSENQRFKAIGNGWTVDIITWILSFISKEVNESESEICNEE